ncbi:MAG: NgoFVII family restriction endonuclease [Nitrospina sp.]|jgi:hypothetical protein|nr:NgoFVII family restriction endonuclease [Nitrospina sp.]
MSLKILSGNNLKERLSEVIPEANSLTVVSAYITKPAVEWLVHHTSSNCSTVLIGRFSPNDLSMGSSDTASIRLALSKGWTVKCLSVLHAKIYLCDRNAMFVGSANLTTNGLKIYGSGNLEACVEVSPIEDNIKFVKKINAEAQPITIEVLEKMEAFIDKNPTITNRVETSSIWPEDILPREDSIWVYDFPWANLSEPERTTEQSLKHDIEALGIVDSSNKTEAAIAFQGTKVFHWLLKKLKESDSRETYFGNLTAALHNDLNDDPTPYRRDVKNLLSNLLSYCQKYTQELIVIDRPSHSQRIKLISEV